MRPNDLILIVENDMVDIMTIRRAMRDLEIRNPLEIAKNGEEAIDLLQQPGRALPALILLDLNMPRMSGLELLEIIKQDHRFRTIPVIVFTTSSEQSDRSRAYEHSVAGYMVKPVDYDQFLLMMRATFSYWYFNELPPVITTESSIISST